MQQAPEDSVAFDDVLAPREGDGAGARTPELVPRDELQDFVENAPVALHWVAADGTILWANRAELELLGYGADEYIGHSIVEFHADRHDSEEMLARLGRGEELCDHEARMLTRDGTIRHVAISSNAYRRQGLFVHTRCFTRDVTEQRRLEQARLTSLERTERLMTITAAIADAVSRQEVFDAVVDQVAAALAASSAGLWLVGEDGRTATLVRGLGYAQAAVQAMGEVALDAPRGLPITDSIRRGVPLWLDSQEELLAAYPHLAPVVSPGRSYRIACLPVVVNERTRGGLALTFEGGAPLDGDRRDFLLLVARHCAQALERLRLFDDERKTRGAAEASAARMAVLSRASKAFSEAAADLQSLLQTIAAQTTIGYADGCAITLLGDDNETLAIAAVHHRDPARTASVRALLEAAPLRVGHGLTGRVAATGEALLLRTVEPAQLASSEGDEPDALLPHSLVAVPLRAQGRLVGVLTASRDAGGPPFSADDQRLLEELAERAAMALESSRLHADNRQARQRAELLYRLAATANRASGVDEVFAAALDAIEHALGARRSSVLAFDGNGVMRFKAWRGLSDEYRRAVAGHSPWSADERAPAPILIADAASDPAVAGYRALFRQEGIAALGFIPLVASGRLVGKFMVYYDRPRRLAAPELELAQAIANHLAAAIARFAAVEELQQTVRFNEMFAGILGHDLRNPLGAIMNSAQLALSRGASEKVAQERLANEKLTKPLSRILSSGRRMARMIDQLLDFTRVRVGAGIPLEPRPADLGAVLRQVIDELDDAHSGTRLSLDHLGGDTAGHWDEDRLAQVFSNLVANALQHGSIEHGVRVRIDGNARDRVRIEVHNMGAIPAALVPKLFEPMTGGDRRRDKSQGLGLGLYISREILKAHGGFVDVESTDSGGTTFAVSLPRTARTRGGPP